MDALSWLIRAGQKDQLLLSAPPADMALPADTDHWLHMQNRRDAPLISGQFIDALHR